MLTKAIKQASKSSYRQRVGAVLVKGDRILATGYNHLRGHGSLKSNHWDNSLHAEMHCILNAIKTVGAEGIKGSTMFVARLKRDGSTGLALPCKDCFTILQKMRVKRIIFSTNEGVSEIKV